MIRRGVLQKTARGISGHKTDAVFSRYDMVSEADIRDAARKIEQGAKADRMGGPRGVSQQLAVASVATAKEAILAKLPASADAAITKAGLFTACLILSKSTGERAIKELLTAKLVQGRGEGICGVLFRYWRGAVD